MCETKQEGPGGGCCFCELQTCNRQHDLPHWTRYKDLVGDKEFQCSHLIADTHNQYEIRNQSKSKTLLGNLHRSEVVCTLQQLNKEKIRHQLTDLHLDSLLQRPEQNENIPYSLVLQDTFVSIIRMQVLLKIKISI